VVVVLLVVGDHVPLILLVDRVGNVKDVPEQNGPNCVNSGVTGWLTVTVIVVVVAHCPAVGVKVYVVVAALFTAGDHVPVIVLLEVVGSVNDPPLHIAATCVNVGTIAGLTVTVIFVWPAHWPAVGVKM
jgi:hypothetical protein